MTVYAVRKDSVLQSNQNAKRQLSNCFGNYKTHFWTKMHTYYETHCLIQGKGYLFWELDKRWYPLGWIYFNENGEVLYIYVLFSIYEYVEKYKEDSIRVCSTKSTWEGISITIWLLKMQTLFKTTRSYMYYLFQNNTGMLMSIHFLYAWKIIFCFVTWDVLIKEK